MIYLHKYTIYIYIIKQEGMATTPRGRSHFSGINRRPGDRGKNVDRGGEGRGGYPLIYQYNKFFLGGYPPYVLI